MTTFIASSTVFSILIFAAMAGVTLAAAALVILFVRDWRRKRIW